MLSRSTTAQKTPTTQDASMAACAHVALEQVRFESKRTDKQIPWYPTSLSNANLEVGR